ncbi:MAG: hypothetical protein WCZ89_06295 [Phycisphaerae bacterium]
MLRKPLSLFVVFASIVLFSTSSFGLDFMGPPVSTLEKRQFGGGLEYSFGDIDFSWNNGKRFFPGGGGGPLQSVKFNTDWEMRKISAYLEYGALENWDVFLRLGCVVVDGQGRMPWGTEGDLNGNHGHAYGFGTRATIWEQSSKLKWGALFQVNWNNDLAGKMKTVMDGQTTTMKYKYSFTEYQIAFGPRYQIKERCYIYGGPFLHFISGKVHSKGDFDDGGGVTANKYSWDIKERSTVGGYLGLQVDVIENKLPLFVEYQHTAAADMLAMNLIMKF